MGNKAKLNRSLNSLLFYYFRLQSAELQLKSEVASTRLRYEQQVKNLSGELNSMQVSSERRY